MPCVGGYLLRHASPLFSAAGSAPATDSTHEQHLPLISLDYTILLSVVGNLSATLFFHFCTEPRVFGTCGFCCTDNTELFALTAECQHDPSVCATCNVRSLRESLAQKCVLEHHHPRSDTVLQCGVCRCSVHVERDLLGRRRLAEQAQVHALVKQIQRLEDRFEQDVDRVVKQEACSREQAAYLIRCRR